ncbi:MAG TPA: MBL fold metallo-hydrolase [Candidatus Saccharimonadales bacterium]|jgi:glyoxylase-like metal-dependent hydrolase (beta-lactamase superfamily II)|nr:MBL fold metallo-hydrolase [Candidatus Saccharimonadales bacterium]
MAKHFSLDVTHRIYPMRGLFGCFHLLHDASAGKAVLIDTGLVGEMPRLTRLLGELGLLWTDITAVLMTHGHLDHSGNLFRIQQLTSAPVLAHPVEQRHIDGTFPYTGISRVCGALEAVGRSLLRYRPAPIDQPLSDGMELPYWGGLRVIHLPGHTGGHCGFYSARFELIFTGDLFASYGRIAHMPPAILNSCPEHFPASLKKVQALSPRHIIPNHYFGVDGERHCASFGRLLARHT